MFTFFTLTAVTKFSSDGSILFNFCHEGGDCRTAHAGKPTSLEKP
jgi:hypothetical protein